MSFGTKISEIEQEIAENKSAALITSLNKLLDIQGDTPDEGGEWSDDPPEPLHRVRCGRSRRHHPNHYRGVGEALEIRRECKAVGDSGVTTDMIQLAPGSVNQAYLKSQTRH